MPIRVYIAYQADAINPLSNEFTLTNLEMALLKIQTTDEIKLKKGIEVIAEEDVAMEIR